ncbi:hypothetical protein LCGC14_1023070 [marine sediment metagenome]|uniref:Uncharacterized protein n=1 Tax=marine sediment metagenome TaxID=412755 RepID=A0A0F9QF16_9ZZZZ
MIICANCHRGLDRHTRFLYFCMEGNGYQHFERFERRIVAVA